MALEGRGGDLTEVVVLKRAPRLPEPMRREDGWRARAHCRPPATATRSERLARVAMFFPSKDVERISERVRVLCESCPVRPDCLAYALLHREKGIWGGTTEKERSALRRRYRRASCPICGPAPLLEFEGRQVCMLCGLAWLAQQARNSAGIIGRIIPGGIEEDDAMTPEEVIAAAKPGDTILYWLRGPASDDEIAGLTAQYETAYPGVTFKIAATGKDEPSRAELIRG